MSKKHLALPLALLAAAALAASGCGGDEDAEASLTLKQYQYKSNIICNEASIEQFEIAGRFFQKNPGAEESEVVELAIPPLEKELEELKELNPPEGFQDEVEAYLEAYEEGLEGLKENPEAAVSENEAENPFKEANRLGRKYKMGDCGTHP